MQKRHPDILGSEFHANPEARRSLWKNLAEIGSHGQMRFEDVSALSFDDSSFDAVISFDVLEHVPDWWAALAEFGGTLEPGGICISTFPFLDNADTLPRARFTPNGQIEHLLEP